MRRREKFVIASILLSLGFLGSQYVNLDYRYWAVLIFSLLSYLVSAWVLSDDLQRYELITIVPFPAFYSAGVGLFYFLLPESLFSRIFILVLFSVGMYGLYLTLNIFSVAKGRSIQLLHAAHAIYLLFTLLTSLLFLNTILSLKLPFWSNGILTALTHFPLIFLSLWSIKLEPKVGGEIVPLSLMLTLVLVEMSVVLSFYPFSVWHVALFVMSTMYIGLGVFHSYLKDRLFVNTLQEYSMVAGLIAMVFFILLPWR